VLDVDRLVNNLCTVWVGCHKLQANIPRFQKEPLKRHSSLYNNDGVKRGNSGDTYNSNGVKGAANSYAHVVKGSQNSKMDSDSSPVMVFWVRAKEVPGWIPDFMEDNDEEEDSEESICSGHFKKSKVPKSGGSILQLIDDLVKMGETMGYDMKGCMKNMEEIIELQGANDSH
nr:nucleotide-binding alpha-beta plait domain-containing protein [Tanacetum cinerariifolium]